MVWVASLAAAFKYPDKSNLGWDCIHSQSQVHYCGRIKQQELEATSHITTTVRKQRGWSAHCILSSLGQGPTYEKGTTHTQEVFPPQHDQNSPPHPDIYSNKLPTLVNPSPRVSSQVTWLTTKTDHDSFETQRDIRISQVKYKSRQ